MQAAIRPTGDRERLFLTLDAMERGHPAWVKHGLGRDSPSSGSLPTTSFASWHRVLRDGEALSNAQTGGPLTHNLKRRKARPFREVMELLRDA